MPCCVNLPPAQPLGPSGQERPCGYFGEIQTILKSSQQLLSQRWGKKKELFRGDFYALRTYKELCFLGRVNIIHRQRLSTDFKYCRVNVNHPRYQYTVQPSNPQVLSSGWPGCREGFSTCREPVLKCVSFNCKSLSSLPVVACHRYRSAEAGRKYLATRSGWLPLRFC